MQTGPVSKAGSNEGSFSLACSDRWDVWAQRWEATGMEWAEAVKSASENDPAGTPLGANEKILMPLLRGASNGPDLS